ncbi:conserved Plasmodium protein, unknown function [Plasmodium gallinaceum]|uniref:Uncharacterized protein n=1 Tax=Plasmodium gallinaceum TaxID=5849 RepID=A0A1J1GQQ6_PLAGA|nr:conserved Plasmodium protein, unknown function [Plasmodium gallinaceum]CRG94847.1 conserved Plasmodium protein, unknown function [Plasmodium gallinaceum]
MLSKSGRNVLLKCLKSDRNSAFSNLINIYEVCGNEILRKYSTGIHNLSTNIINQNSYSFLNKNNQILKINLRKCFSTSSIQSNITSGQTTKNVSSECSKNLSIVDNSNVLIFFDKNQPETIGQKIYRYLDITGFLTRYNNRKEWILDLDPYTRLSTVMLTEYERKLMIFLKFHVYLLFGACVYLWYHAQIHFTMKPPCPKPYAYGHLDGRKRDFTWHGKLFFIYPKTRCKECRWLDVQCKKECFEKLKLEGHKFIINKGDPLSVPKTVLYPSHFH